MKDFVEELRWREMVHDIMPGTREVLNKGMTTAYIGFDPTADSLHVGSMVQIMTLVHLQKCGHKPIALLGGATGMVGDPSGKSAERGLLDEETLNHNLLCIEKQLESFLDFGGANAAEVVNNYDWFRKFNFLDFIRDVGKHITVNYMMAKDAVKSRLESGLSFTEFSYQLVQGYDFYYLWKYKNAKLQLGGSDQWGNIITGTELIRRKEQGDAFAMTTPLLTKADGSKFGKSEGENIWLDPKKTSPYKFYQYWVNTSDEDAEKYIRIFSLKEKEVIESLIMEHREAPHQRLLQKILAREVTERVHSKIDLETAVKASSVLFGKAAAEDLAGLDEKTWMQVFEGVPQTEVLKAKLENTDVTTFLSEATHNLIFKSKGEARKMIQGGGVSINKSKITSPEAMVNCSLLQGKYLLVQKGRKNYFLIKVV